MASALHLRSYSKLGIEIPQRPERGEQDPLSPHSDWPLRVCLRSSGRLYHSAMRVLWDVLTFAHCPDAGMAGTIARATNRTAVYSRIMNSPSWTLDGLFQRRVDLRQLCAALRLGLWLVRSACRLWQTQEARSVIAQNVSLLR
jgi:hypothetical protein